MLSSRSDSSSRESGLGGTSRRTLAALRTQVERNGTGPLAHVSCTRGLQSVFLGETATLQNTNNQVGHKLRVEEQNLAGTVQHHVREGSHRDSPQQGVSGILLKTVSSAKTKWRLATSDRSKYSQSVSQDPEVQNGHNESHTQFFKTRKLGIQRRLKRRLLSGADASVRQEISTDGVFGTILSVPSSPFRHKHGAVAIHNDCDGCERVVSSPGVDIVSIPRRLARRCRDQSCGVRESRASSESLHTLRFSDKYREVGTHSDSSLRFCGHAFRSCQRQSPHYRKEQGQGPEVSQELSGSQTSHGSKVAESDRDFTGSGSFHLPRQTESEAVTVSPCGELGPRVTTTTHICQCASVDARPDAVVVGRGRSVRRGSSSEAKSHTPNVHRCFQHRLGSTPRQCNLSGNMAGRGATSPYKLSRDAGCQTSPSRISGASDVLCTGLIRQHDSSRVHKQARRHQVLDPVAGDSDAVSDSHRAEHSAVSEVYPRKAKRHCRRPLKERTDSAHRVVLTSKSCRTCLQPLGSSLGRLVRNKTKPQVSNLCFSRARQPGMGRRRPLNFLGRAGRLCVSSNSNPVSGTAEVQRHEVLSHSVDSTLVAQTELVSDSAAAHTGSSIRSSGVREDAQATNKQCLPSSSRVSGASCVVVIQESLVSKGFSQKASERIAAPHAPTTTAIYKGKWRVFAAWCADKDIEPFKAEPAQVAEFLLYLFEVKGLAFKTLEGYRTAIARPLRYARGIDIAENQAISSLLQSFRRERPTLKNPYPQWDLSLVLLSLTKAPFEPLRVASLRNLTFKTVFLVLLASGARKSEVHALSFKAFSHAQHWREVVLTPIPSFVSKTQFRSSGNSVLRDIRIPSLAHSLGQDLAEDRTLCPVRALKIYLARTQDMRRNKQLLFVSYRPSFEKDISKNTLSSWIKSLLNHVYSNPNEEVAQISGRTTHAIRALAATLAFTSQAGLDEVLRACSWKTHSTFTEFYLKDLTHMRENLLILGPLVAAQTITQPR